MPSNRISLFVFHPFLQHPIYELLCLSEEDNMLRLTLTGIKVVYYGEHGSLISPTDDEAASTVLNREGWYGEQHALKFFHTHATEQFPIYVWQDHQAINRLMLHFGSCTFINAAGQPISKQQLRAIRADHLVLADLFAKEEAKVLSDYSIAAAYSDRVFNGGWDDFISKLYTDPAFALEHAQVYSGDHRKALESVILKCPMTSSRYAKTVLGQRWEEAEPLIAKEAGAAVHYAAVVLGGRWAEAEDTISKSPMDAVRYAELVLHDRWQESEQTILSDANASWAYITQVVMERWAEAEDEILKHPLRAAEYARDYLGGRWEAAEEVIATDPGAALIYSRDVLKGRWEQAEAAIMTDPVAAAQYAYQVLKQRWEQAEDIIKGDAEASYRYVLKALKRRRMSEFEASISTSPLWAFAYAVDVIGGRWFEVEPLIMTRLEIWKRYVSEFPTSRDTSLAMAS